MQPTPSNMTGTNVLQPVSWEWTNKVAEVKRGYVYYRSKIIGDEIKKLNKKKNKDSSEEKQLEYLDKEQDQLIELQRKLDNNQEWEREVWEDLWIDQIIGFYIQSLSNKWEQRWRTDLQEEYTRVCKEFKDYDKHAYRRLSREKGIKEEEVKKILFIFVQYYFLAKDLYCRDSPIQLDNQLRLFKDKHPLDSLQIQDTAD